MKIEQMELVGKVIEFPDSYKKEIAELKDKLEVAKIMLDYLTSNGVDFQIVVEREGVGLSDLLNIENSKKEYIVLTSNLDKTKKLTDQIDAGIFPIVGDEF